MNHNLNESNNSGNSLTYKWLTGITVGILIMIVGSWVASVQAAVTKVPILEEKLSNVSTQLEKVNSKLDNISGALNIPMQK